MIQNGGMEDLDILVNKRNKYYFKIKMKKDIIIILLFIISIEAICQKIKVNRNDLEYVFIDAVKSIKFGEYSKAAYLLNNTIKIDPSCGSCYYELSKIYYYVGDTFNALNYSKLALQKDKKNYWYIRNVEKLKFDFGYIKEAKIGYENMIKNKIAKTDDMFDLANIYLKLKKEKKALKILNEIENENGILETVNFLKYKYYLKGGKIGQSKKEIEKLLEISKENLNLYGILAELNAMQKNDSGALKYYNTILNIEPNNVSALISLGKFYISRNDTSKARITLDRIFFNDKIEKNLKLYSINEFMGDTSDYYISKIYLKEILNRLQSNYPKTIEYYEASVDYYEKMHDYKNAIIKCNELIELGLNKPIYWEKLFYYYQILGDYKMIINNIDSITKIYDNRPFIYLLGGIAYYSNSDYKNAINLLKKGTEIKDNNYDERFISFLTESYYKIGKKDSAYYYFEQELYKKNKNISQINNYAYYLAENNDSLVKALNLSLFTIKFEPENFVYLDTYAWILFKLKKYNDAKKYIMKSIKYGGSNDADIVDHSGDIFFCNGKKGKAMKQWEKAIYLGSNKDSIMEKIRNYKCK